MLFKFVSTATLLLMAPSAWAAPTTPVRDGDFLIAECSDSRVAGEIRGDGNTPSPLFVTYQLRLAALVRDGLVKGIEGDWVFSSIDGFTGKLKGDVSSFVETLDTETVPEGSEKGFTTAVLSGGNLVEIVDNEPAGIYGQTSAISAIHLAREAQGPLRPSVTLTYVDPQKQPLGFYGCTFPNAALLNAILEK